MIAVSQYRTVKTEQKRPTFKAATYIHSESEPVRLPKADCIVIVIPAEPLNDSDGYRVNTSGNPFMTFNPTGVEFASMQPTGQYLTEVPKAATEVLSDQFAYSGSLYVATKDAHDETVWQEFVEGFIGLKPGVINMTTSFRPEVS